MSENTEPTPEAVEELRKILGDHWAAGMARSGAPAEWECVCDVALEMSDEAHQAHTAREVLAAGYISPLVHSARAAAWLARFEKAEATIARLKALADDLDKKSDAAYERRYAEDWAYHEGRGDAYEEAEGLIRAALAEPERIADGDDEPPALEAS